jgi:hypothetical protein
MHKLYLSLAVFFLLSAIAVSQKNNTDLSGKWSVRLEEDKNEMNIDLPGSLAEAGYGQKTTGSDFGILTPTYKYTGKARFTKEITIPKNWKNKTLQLFLERVLWQSKVFIDGKEISIQDALGTPHVHQLGILKPGKHVLTVEVDNNMIHNIGDKGHAYSDYTQSIWNGITGRIELQAKDLTHFESVRTYSDIDKDQLKVELDLTANKSEKAEINIEITEQRTGKLIHTFKIRKKLFQGKNNESIIIDLNNKLKKWSEFTPVTYILKASVKTRKYYDETETEFGFVKISHDNTHVLINDQPVFLRGNLDCIHFPLTGYPSTSVEEWEHIFKIYREYGLNHVRFHSWCPPEAAFKAANRTGIYIQAEASVWIDWWMGEDMKTKGRPEMDTKGHPKGLGKDPERDQFVVAEMNRVIDFYGNNPSFTLFCIGNELGNSDFNVMSKWIGDLKKKDPRRLYAISTARKITDVDDFSATHYIPDVGRTRGLNGAGTDWDFEKVYSKMNIPIIAHEIGQWPVYPSWKEIEKYKGVLKARNFEGFRVIARKNGIEDQDEDFRKASGALNQIMYKYETESFLRTKSCAGVQLLSMQDYQGQGEALIGWLDAFWESKGITTPEKFREHFDETVPLLRIKKFIWYNNKTLKAKLQLSHYGNSEIRNGHITLKITNTAGELLKEQHYPVQNIRIGTLTDLGTLSFPLSGIKKAEQLNISLQLDGTRFKNEWSIWVYPKDLLELQADENIYITEEMNEETLSALKEGKKVLLLAHDLGNEENSVSVDFYPLYWSLTFFPGQGKTSIGMLFKERHPVFKYFPTSGHSDWQWEPFRKSTKAFILNDMPAAYKPIAQVVDDFHRNNKEGVIFEFKTGKGKLLVCGYDVTNRKIPGASQLKYSLLKYMDSGDFQPVQQVSPEYLKALFPEIPKAEKVKTNLKFENALLQVDAASNLKENETSRAWSAKADQVIVAKEGAGYSVLSEGIWKDDHVSAWHGKEMNITINCPEGMLGTLYVEFNDWNNKGREGFLEFEGRKVKLQNHQGKEGKWVKFHVMREDSNDGKLTLKTSVTKGGNLMISQIVLVKE